MPESSGKDIRHAVNVCWPWLFSCLENELASTKIHVRIDWSRLTLFGESFGAYPAVDSWLLLLQHANRPAGLRTRGMILRAPLSDFYKRTPRDYHLYLGGGLTKWYGKLGIFLATLLYEKISPCFRDSIYARSASRVIVVVSYGGIKWEGKVGGVTGW
jgi:hypothetical protein